MRTSMEQNQTYLINKIFTIPYLDKVITDQDRKYLNQYIERYILKKKITYGKAIDEIYMQMDKEYRNEYFFKNTILNKLLIEKQSEHVAAFSELSIAKSKADMVMIDDRGIVYEIKTDLDDFDRLQNQIKDYYKAFSYVNVVVSYKQYYKVKEILKDTKVGIYVLYSSGNLIPRKRAMCNRDALSYDSLFKILRKNEYESILSKYKISLPETNDFLYYKECRKKIEKIGITTLQKEMQECLKKRNFTVEKELLKKEIPYSLQFYTYFSMKNMREYNRLKAFVNEKVEEKHVLSVS